MGRSNAATRRKRAQRRAGAQHTGGVQAADLVPHTPHCPCAACEEKRKHQLRRGITQTEKRLRRYSCGDPQPEHRDEWRISGHRLIAYFATHDAYRDSKAHLTRVEMRDEFVSYLDSVVPQSAMDAGRMYQALVVMRSVHPLRARIVDACICQQRSQQEVGAAEHMSHQAVSQNLEAGADLLRDLYAGLTLYEQTVCVA